MKLYLYRINDSYLLAEGYGKDYLIDGKLVKNFDKGWLPEKPKEIKLLEERERVVRYGDLSPEEFERERKKLLKGNIFSEGEFIFENLEDEYKYRKFLQEHPPIKEQYTEYIDCEIVEYDITGRTDIEYIKPFRLIGKKPVSKEGKVLYQYTPEPYKMAQEIGKKLGFEEVTEEIYDLRRRTKGKKWAVPSHSRDNLRFLMINGNYTEYETLKFHGVIGSWEECYKQYEKDYKSIEKLFLRALKEIESKNQPIDKAAVLRFLEEIKRGIRRIKARAQSGINPLAIVSQIDEFIEKITEK